MDIKSKVKLPVRTDKFGVYIFDADGKVISQVRGFGWMKNLVGEDKAHVLQKDLADWLVFRINGIQTNSTSDN